MRKAIATVTTFAALLAAPAAALAGSAPGVGSNVNGRDSAGGYFGFAFDALTHGSLGITGAYMYSLGDTFNCKASSGGKPQYGFNTFGPPHAPKYPGNTLQPFPTVNDSYQSFHYIFSIKYQAVTHADNQITLLASKSLGTVTVSVTGRIKQISGPVGGPGNAIANGTIGMRVSGGSCHTGTLKWSAKGTIVNPNPDA
jgi:hypothetical protein